MENINIKDVNYAVIGVENENIKSGEVWFDVNNEEVRFFIGDLMVILCTKGEFLEALSLQPVFEGGLFIFDEVEFDVLYIETETEEPSCNIMLHYEA